MDLKEIHCDTITPLYSEDSLKFISNFYALFNNKPEINHDPQISTPEQNIIKGQFEEMISFTKFSCVPGVTFINQLVPKASQRALFYGWFDILKPHFINKTGRKDKRSWWEQNLNFDSLFPMEYNWTLAPRLSARGFDFKLKK